MEIWKDVKDYEGIYQVSNLGRVKVLEKMVWNRFKMILKNEKILKFTIDKSGYYRLGLTKDNMQKNFLVHRLVCIAFLPNPQKKETVNHINGIKTDNRLLNLEWATHSENQKHSHQIGLKCFKGEKGPNSKLTKEQVLDIKNNYKNLTQREIAKIFNVSQSNISIIRNSINWKHI
jgi:hypothetical protein